MIKKRFKYASRVRDVLLFGRAQRPMNKSRSCGRVTSEATELCLRPCLLLCIHRSGHLLDIHLHNLHNSLTAGYALVKDPITSTFPEQSCRSTTSTQESVTSSISSIKRHRLLIISILVLMMGSEPSYYVKGVNEANFRRKVSLNHLGRPANLINLSHDLLPSPASLSLLVLPENTVGICAQSRSLNPTRMKQALARFTNQSTRDLKQEMKEVEAKQ